MKKEQKQKIVKNKKELETFLKHSNSKIAEKDVLIQKKIDWTKEHLSFQLDFFKNWKWKTLSVK